MNDGRAVRFSRRALFGGGTADSPFIFSAQAGQQPIISAADLNPLSNGAPLAFQGFVNLFLNGQVKRGGIQLAVGILPQALLNLGAIRLGLAGASVQELRVFRSTKVIVTFAHNLMAIRPVHLPPPGSPVLVQHAVEGAIQNGRYILKDSGLFEGSTLINGARVGFRGRFVGGVARVATVFTQR